MVEISTAISYTLRLSEKEYKLVAKSLALLAGVEGPKASPEDQALAAALNTKLLELQAADLREKLAAAEHKRKA